MITSHPSPRTIAGVKVLHVEFVDRPTRHFGQNREYLRPVIFSHMHALRISYDGRHYQERLRTGAALVDVTKLHLLGLNRT